MIANVNENAVNLGVWNENMYVLLGLFVVVVVQSNTSNKITFLFNNIEHEFHTCK